MSKSQLCSPVKEHDNSKIVSVDKRNRRTKKLAMSFTFETFVDVLTSRPVRGSFHAVLAIHNFRNALETPDSVRAVAVLGTSGRKTLCTLVPICRRLFEHDENGSGKID